MDLKRLNFLFIIFLTIILFGNSFFIINGYAYSYSNPSTTPLWSYSTGDQYISAVAISYDGKYIIASSENLVYNITVKANGKLYLFNNSISDNKSPLWNYSILNDFSSLAISKDGSYILAGGGALERKVYLFNSTNSFLPQWTYNTYGWVYDVDISEDGNIGVAASGERKKVYLFNISEAYPKSEFSTTGLALRAVLSSNGSYMAVTDNAGMIYFFNTSDVLPKWNYILSGNISTALSISSDGNYIASGGDKVYLFKKSSSFPIWTYQTSDYVKSIKISEDGNYIVAGGYWADTNVYLFNRNSSTPEWTYSTGGAIVSVASSYNGDYLVALNNNYWVYLFNKSSSEPIWRYRLDGYPTASYDYSLGISLDGKYIVVGGRHYVYLFDRDIIIPPKLIIPDYYLFFMILIIGIVLLASIIIIFLKHKKNTKKSLKNK